MSATITKVRGWCCALAILLGLWSGLLISFVTEYYTSNTCVLVREIVEMLRTCFLASLTLNGMPVVRMSLKEPVLASCASAETSDPFEHDSAGTTREVPGHVLWCLRPVCCTALAIVHQLRATSIRPASGSEPTYELATTSTARLSCGKGLWIPACSWHLGQHCVHRDTWNCFERPTCRRGVLSTTNAIATLPIHTVAMRSDIRQSWNSAQSTTGFEVSKSCDILGTALQEARPSFAQGTQVVTT